MIPAARRAASTLLAIAAIAAAAAPAGCKRHVEESASAGEAKLPPIRVADDTPGLVLTWMDDKGEAHVALRPADVPAAGRSLVRVVITDHDEGTGDRFYVADLTRKDDDGAYPTRTMLRRDWELELERRRDANAPPGAPPPGARGDRPAPPGQAQDTPAVIIYGASWCKPCHMAADYLRRRGVAYVMKDIEETPGAAAEMREKLRAVGRARERSIPVIDVRGQILVGFDQSSVDQALAKTAGRERR